MEVDHLKHVQTLVKQMFHHLGVRDRGVHFESARPRFAVNGIVHSFVVLKIKNGRVRRGDSREAEQQVIQKDVRRIDEEARQKNKKMYQACQPVPSGMPFEEKIVEIGQNGDGEEKDEEQQKQGSVGEGPSTGQHIHFGRIYINSMLLNTSYVMEFFLQTLVKKKMMPQMFMLLLQNLLMVASGWTVGKMMWEAAGEGNRLLLPSVATLSVALNFWRRGHEVANVIAVATVAHLSFYFEK